MEQLPIWFLFLSLLLPRLSLLCGYFIFDISIILHLQGWVPPILAVLIPRALILILIFQDRGMSPWLIVHAVAMGFVYLAAGESK